MKLTTSQRLKTARAYRRLMATRESRLKFVLKGEFNRVVRDASQNYPDWEKVIPQHKQRLLSIFQVELKRTALAGVMHVRESLGKCLPVRERKLDTEEELNQRVADWVRSNAADKVEAGDTTRRRIRNCIARGLEDGLTPDEIARSIVEEVGSMSDSRALVIARTETAAAMNTGQHMEMEDMAEESGLKVKKVWTATEDERTRESHSAADGQRVDLDEMFKVGDAELMYPSDPNGPPEEIINCRCVSVYEAT